MLIDWFTVCAQIINFLILVWLLKRFLFGRILKAIDARDRRIAEALAEAETRQAEAREQAADCAEKLKAIEKEREAMLTRARVDAEQQHAELLDRARRHIHDLESKWQDDLAREREAFLENLRRRAAAEVVTIVRRVIADMTSRDLEHCAVETFLQQIRLVDRQVWSRFVTRNLLVRSAIDLPEDERAEIAQAVEEQIGAPVRLEFESDRNVGLGLELCGDGWRIGWSSKAYLETLEEDLNDAITESSGACSMAAETSK